MTSIRLQSPRPTKPHRLLCAGSIRRRTIGVVALIGVGLLLAGCGRKGAPEFDNGEPVVKSDTNQLIPGLNLPQKTSTPEKKAKPKGNFVLDPLL